jgi:hypothetical protein
MRRTTVAPLISAVLVAALCWYLGVDVWHAVALGAVLATVGVIGLVAADDPRLTSIVSDDERPANRAGARGDIAELSWALRGRYGLVGQNAERRVQRLGRNRLAPYQLDPRVPEDRRAIEQLIGRRACAVLAGRRRRRPSLPLLLHCLDALDALSPEESR